MIALFLSLPIALGAYFKDETVTGYLPAAGPWALEEVDGETADVAFTLAFVPGGIEAAGPCLRLTATQTAPYPWFEARETATAAGDCTPSEAETAAMDRLAAMNLAEALGEVLILSDDDGGEMVFRLGQD